MKTYSNWPEYLMTERRNGEDRRVNPKLTADPEERKGDRRISSIVHGLHIPFALGENVSGRANIATL